MQGERLAEIGRFLLPWLLTFALLWSSHSQQIRHEESLTQLLYGASIMTDDDVREFFYEVTPPAAEEEEK